MILLVDGEYPDLYVIPASTWKEERGKVFVHRTYEGKKSKPEYGINLSAKNIPLIEKYKLENMIETITIDKVF